MWPNPQETADLVTFTGEILNGKLHFLCSGSHLIRSYEAIWEAAVCINYFLKEDTSALELLPQKRYFDT